MADLNPATPPTPDDKKIREESSKTTEEPRSRFIGNLSEGFVERRRIPNVSALLYLLLIFIIVAGMIFGVVSTVVLTISWLFGSLDIFITKENQISTLGKLLGLFLSTLSIGISAFHSQRTQRKLSTKPYEMAIYLSAKRAFLIGGKFALPPGTYAGTSVLLNDLIVLPIPQEEIDVKKVVVTTKPGRYSLLEKKNVDKKVFEDGLKDIPKEFKAVRTEKEDELRDRIEGMRLKAIEKVTARLNGEELEVRKRQITKAADTELEEAISNLSRDINAIEEEAREEYRAQFITCDVQKVIVDTSVTFQIDPDNIDKLYVTVTRGLTKFVNNVVANGLTTMGNSMTWMELFDKRDAYVKSVVNFINEREKLHQKGFKLLEMNGGTEAATPTAIVIRLQEIEGSPALIEQINKLQASRISREAKVQEAQGDMRALHLKGIGQRKRREEEYRMIARNPRYMQIRAIEGMETASNSPSDTKWFIPTQFLDRLGESIGRAAEGENFPPRGDRPQGFRRR